MVSSAAFSTDTVGPVGRWVLEEAGKGGRVVSGWREGQEWRCEIEDGVGGGEWGAGTSKIIIKIIGQGIVVQAGGRTGGG